MLIEQAFYNLPEILVGSGYAKQDYEAGIVSAFSLAILQELNGRNANNPISHLHAERRYNQSTTVSKLNSKLRADLYVKLDRLSSGSKTLADFGFRHSNWIEAKFFKLGKGAPPSTQNLGAVVADLLRLTVLVPLEISRARRAGEADCLYTGRYFLHVYRGGPLLHLNPNRKARGAAKRKWVELLLQPGYQLIPDFELDKDKGKAFTKYLGHGFGTMKLSLGVTNFVLKPIKAPTRDTYTLVLTRIEEASVSFEKRTFKFNADRTFELDSAKKFEEFRLSVADKLKVKKEKTVDVEEVDEYVHTQADLDYIDARMAQLEEEKRSFEEGLSYSREQ